MDKVKVVAGVGERDIALVKEGTTQATVRVDAYPDEVFPGTVRKVSPVADERTRTVEVEIHIDNPGYRLKPGMFARVDLTLQERANAVVIPDHAVLRADEATFLYVVEGTTARRRAVRLGLAEGERVEVLEGVRAGERVVTRGQRLLEEGSAVTVVEEEERPE
jgi:membrane fusion protein (multidrug efflux system)